MTAPFQQGGQALRVNGFAGVGIDQLLQVQLRLVGPSALQADHHQLFQRLPLSRLCCQHLAQQVFGPGWLSPGKQLLRAPYFVAAVLDGAS